MSSYYRYGDFDGINGKTASELAQSRIDAKTNDIRRPGRKIDVMSEEEWKRRVEKARKAREAWQAKELEAYEMRRATAAEAVGRILGKYHERLNQQRNYQVQIAKKLKAYHEKPAGDTTSPEDWKATYEETARFLAGTLQSFHYEIDRQHGTIQGPNLSRYREFCYRYNIPRDSPFWRDVPSDFTLKSYVKHRNVEISDDEAVYFEGLVDQKVGIHVPDRRTGYSMMLTLLTHRYRLISRYSCWPP